MFTELLRTRPRVGYPLMVLLLVLLTLIGVGGAAAGADDHPGTAVFLGYVGAVGVVGIVAVLAEVAALSRRPVARLATTAGGERATYLPYGVSLLVGPVGALVAAVGAGVAGAVVAGRNGSTGGLVVAVVVGLAALGWLLPVLLGRVRTGGVWVSPSGVEQARFGSRWRVGWDDVEGVVPQEPLAIVLRPGARVSRERTSPWGWNGDVRAGANLLGISTRHLSVDERALAFLLATSLERPVQRDDLGTPVSLEWPVLRADPQNR
jgi:hypothetical protein